MLLALAFVAVTQTKIGPPPSESNLNTFYKKHVALNGFPIISSEKVPDKAILVALEIVKKMTQQRPEILKEMARQHVKLAVMAFSEQTLDIPEHSDLQKAFPKTDWNKRARGLGATTERPVVSCAEENVLCYGNDRYKGESILIHEFSHAMRNMGIAFCDKELDKEIDLAFKSAMEKGLWQKTYASTNSDEYWAEGVQDWFDCNATATPANGVHNEIHTRVQLKQYDPGLAKAIEKAFGDSDWRWSESWVHTQIESIKQASETKLERRYN